MKRPPRSILWPIAALFLFTASVFHLRDIYLSPPDISAPAVQVADILSAGSLSAHSAHAETQYPEIAERPLFSRSRRPFVPPQPVVVEQPPPEPQPVAAEPQITLQGVMISGRTRHALILAGGEPAPRWLSEGDSVTGWKIKEIGTNGVRLIAEGQTRKVNLYVEKSAASDNQR